MKSKLLCDWKILEGFQESFLIDINLFHLDKFGKQGLIVSTDDKVFIIGIGNNTEKNNLTLDDKTNSAIILEELCGKQICEIYSGEYYFILKSKTCRYYILEIDYHKQLETKEANSGELKFLRDKHIINLSCGGNHFLALSGNGDVYSWGDNKFGQLGHGSMDKVQTSISLKIDFSEIGVKEVFCGDHFSFAVTDDGKVYSWGCNDHGQLGLGTNFEFVSCPTLVESLEDYSISQISCGFLNVLALSKEGVLFLWGDSESKGVMKIAVDISPISEIAAIYNSHLSVFRSGSKIYIMGQSIDGEFKCPTETSYTDINDVFPHVALNSWGEEGAQVMWRTLNFSTSPQTQLKFNFKFNDENTTDVHFIFGKRIIRVHKAVLQSRNEYFRNSFNWKLIARQDERPICIYADETLNGIRFEVLHLLLHYLYTRELKLDTRTEYILDLFKVAFYLSEKRLEEICCEILIKLLNARNVISIYEAANEFNNEKLMKIAMEFMECNFYG